MSTTCSTPCGINGLFTLRRMFQCRFIVRAQRLAASTDCSLDGQPLLLANPVVLNALRHQRIVHTPAEANNRQVKPRCSTPCGINGLFTCIDSRQRGIQLSRAQRLAASTDCSHDCHARRIRDCPCAQRLAASTDCSPVQFPRLNLECRVLNALRHQRIVHISGAGDSAWRVRVLNALRHQRIVHKLGWVKLKRIG